MADSYLVDSGVFVRWFIPQVGFEHAREVRERYLAGTVALSTVDLARFETANTLRKAGLLTGLLTEDEAVAASRVIDDLGVTVHATGADTLEGVARLAARRGISVYDATFVARAVEERLTLLTTDARLCRAVDGLLSTELLRGVAGA